MGQGAATAEAASGGSSPRKNKKKLSLEPKSRDGHTFGRSDGASLWEKPALGTVSKAEAQLLPSGLVRRAHYSGCMAALQEHFSLWVLWRNPESGPAPRPAGRRWTARGSTIRVLGAPSSTRHEPVNSMYTHTRTGTHTDHTQADWMLTNGAGRPTPPPVCWTLGLLRHGPLVGALSWEELTGFSGAMARMKPGGGDDGEGSKATVEGFSALSAALGTASGARILLVRAMAWTERCTLGCTY